MVKYFGNSNQFVRLYRFRLEYFWQITLLFAQQYAPQYYTEYEPNNGRTKNHVYEYAPDKFLAIRSIGNCIDGVFVGPVMLGVDCDSLKEFDDGWIEDNEYPFMVKGIGYNNDSLLINRYVEHPDTVFDGVPFKFNIILNRKSYKNGKKIDWMTLEDIKKKYFPEAKGRCIYTVNKFIFKINFDVAVQIFAINTNKITSK